MHPKLRPLLQRIAWDAVTAHPLSGAAKGGFDDQPTQPQAVGRE